MKPMSSKDPQFTDPSLRPLSLTSWLEPQNMNQNRTVRHRSVRVPKTARARTHGGGLGRPGAKNDVFDHIRIRISMLCSKKI